MIKNNSTNRFLPGIAECIYHLRQPRKLTGYLLFFLAGIILFSSFVSACEDSPQTQRHSRLETSNSGFEWYSDVYDVDITAKVNGVSITPTNWESAICYDNGVWKYGFNVTLQQSLLNTNKIKNASLTHAFTSEFTRTEPFLIYIRTSPLTYDFWDFRQFKADMLANHKLVVTESWNATAYTLVISNFTKDTPLINSKIVVDPTIGQITYSLLSLGGFNHTSAQTDGSIDLQNSSATGYYRNGTYYFTPYIVNHSGSPSLINAIQWSWTEPSAGETNVTAAMRTKNHSFNDDGLILWYDLGDTNENDTNQTLDATGNTQGVYDSGNNAPRRFNITTNGIIGSAISLNASYTEHITAPMFSKMADINTTNFTMAIWAKSYSTGSHQTLISTKPNSVTRGLIFDVHFGQMSFTLYNTTNFATGTVGPTIRTNTWNLYVATWNGSTLVLYLNGTRRYTSAATVTNWFMSPVTDFFRVGNNRFGATNPWDGAFDDVKVWNRSITDAEVASLWNGGCPTCAGGQESNWTDWSQEGVGGVLNLTDVYGTVVQTRYQLNSSTGQASPNASGVTYTIDETGMPAAPDILTVSLNTPTAGGSGTNTTIDFTYVPIGSNPIQSATLYFNASGTWGANNTNATVITNASINTITVTGIPYSNFTWNVYACTNTSVCAWGTNRTFSLQGWTNLTLNKPVNGNQTLAQTIQFNYTPNTTYVIKNATLWTNWTGTWVANNSNASIVTNLGVNTITVTGANQGAFLWNVRLCTFENDCMFADVNYTGRVLLEAAPKVTLTLPVNGASQTGASATFVANATSFYAIANSTLYHNFSGTWQANVTQANALNYSQLIDGIAVGGYVWNVLFCDENNQCSYAIANFTFTRVATLLPPIVNLTLPAEGSTSLFPNATFVANATSEESIANSTLYGNFSGSWAANVTQAGAANFSQKLSSLAVGVYEWNVLFCGSSGLCSFDTSGNRTVRIAYGAAPIVNLTSPANGANSLVPTASFIANATTQYSLSNATLYANFDGTWKANVTTTGNANFSQTINGLSPASYTWNVLFCDILGQCSFDATNRTINLILATPPVVTLVLPLDGSIDDYPSIAFSATAASAYNLANFTLYANFSSDGSWKANVSQTGNSNYSQTISSLAVGVYRWNALACDYYGQCSFASANRTVHLKFLPAPVVNLDFPADNAIGFIPTQKFNATATSGYTIANSTLYGNFTGTWEANVTQANANNFSQTLNSLAVGAWKWNVLVCDQYNQCTFGTNRTLEMQLGSAPIVTLIVPANNSVINSLPINFTAIASSFYPIINATLFANWSGSFVVNDTQVSSSTSYSKNIDGIPNGTHEWNVEFCDDRNQCASGSSGAFVFTFQTTTTTTTTTTSSTTTTLAPGQVQTRVELGNEFWTTLPFFILSFIFLVAFVIERRVEYLAFFCVSCLLAGGIYINGVSEVYPSVINPNANNCTTIQNSSFYSEYNYTTINQSCDFALPPTNLIVRPHNDFSNQGIGFLTIIAGITALVIGFLAYTGKLSTTGVNSLTLDAVKSWLDGLL